MEEIIRQIMDIDSMTLQNKQKNEELIKQKKQSYEEQMALYKQEKMEKATKRAKRMYDEIIEAGKQEYNIEEEKSKKNSIRIENRYMQIESKLLERVLEELFTAEG